MNQALQPATNNGSNAEHRIKVIGSVVVGKELMFSQAQARKESQAALTSDELVQSGVAEGSHLARAMAGERAEGPGRRWEDELDSTGQAVAISNDGLTASYGIFGSPGTGKTHLMLHLLAELMGKIPERSGPDWDWKKFGALILDPKASLVDDITKLMSLPDVRRSKDLTVLNTGYLRRRGETVNVIDCSLSARELGRFLVLAARSAGIEATEPYWFLAWANLFGAALTVLQHVSPFVPTLRELTDAVLHPANGPRRIERYARMIREDVERFVAARTAADQRHTPEFDAKVEEVAQAADDILIHFDRTSSESIRAARIIDSFIRRSFGGFLEHRYACYSRQSLAAPRMAGAQDGANFYDAIIEQGKVVLVSISPSEPEFAKTLCTLVKSLFQQAVMGRKERCRLPAGTPGKLHNFTRPVLIACDEYSEVASELPGQPMGDGHFFALARENGCMGLLATQSVNVLENSSLKQSWRSVFSNFGAKFFMGAADNETVEEATKLAGDEDWEILTRGESISLDGRGFTSNRDFRERKALPGRVLTRTLGKGESVVIGSLDGRATRPDIKMVRVPPEISGIR